MKNERKKWEELEIEETYPNDTWIYILVAIVFLASVSSFILVGATI